MPPSTHVSTLLVFLLNKVTHTTELSKVDMAFRLLRLDNAYVCNAGRLVGVITRDSLRTFIGSREVTAMDENMRYGLASRMTS